MSEKQQWRRSVGIRSSTKNSREASDKQLDACLPYTVGSNAHAAANKGGDDHERLIQVEASLFSGGGDEVARSSVSPASCESDFHCSRQLNISDNQPTSSDPALSLPRLFLICAAQIGSAAVTVTYLSILLPSQLLAVVNPENKGGTLGGLAAAGGILSIFGPPVVGWLSDHYDGPFGRRRPFMAVGLVLSASGLIIAGLLAEATSLDSLAAVYLIITVGGILHSTTFNATIPDLPRSLHGTASGVLGALTMVGFCLGVLLGAGSTRLGTASSYYLLAGVVFFSGCVTLVNYTERSDPDEFDHASPTKQARPTFGSRRNAGISSASDSESTSSLSSESDDEDSAPRSAPSPVHPKLDSPGRPVRNGIVSRIWSFAAGALEPFQLYDFRWVFITRLLVQFGVFTVHEFVLFWVQDVLPLNSVSANTRAAILFIPMIIGASGSSLVVGKLSDDLGGKRKLFLFRSAVALGFVCFVMAFVRNFFLALALMVLFGIAIGTFLALDFALVCDVLPNRDNIARDLGVWHISIVLPQLLAAPIAGALLDSLQRLGVIHGFPFLGYTTIFVLTSLFFFLAAGCFRLLRTVK